MLFMFANNVVTKVNTTIKNPFAFSYSSLSATNTLNAANARTATPDANS